MPKPEPLAVPGYAAPQYAAGDLAAMKPEAIVEAKLAGQLDRVLGVEPREVADRIAAADQLDRDDVKAMTPEEVTAARAAGRLDDLLGTTTPNR